MEKVYIGTKNGKLITTSEFDKEFVLYKSPDIFVICFGLIVKMGEHWGDLEYLGEL